MLTSAIRILRESLSIIGQTQITLPHTQKTCVKNVTSLARRHCENRYFECPPAIRTGVATPAVATVRIPPAMVKPPPTRLTLVPIVLLTWRTGCNADIQNSSDIKDLLSNQCNFTHTKFYPSAYLSHLWGFCYLASLQNNLRVGSNRYTSSSNLIKCQRQNGS